MTVTGKTDFEVIHAFHDTRSVAGFVAAITPAAAAQQVPGRDAFRAIYEEMVEIDSSPTTGSCTKVVQAVAKRLRRAGYAAVTDRLRGSL